MVGRPQKTLTTCQKIEDAQWPPKSHKKMPLKLCAPTMALEN